MNKKRLVSILLKVLLLAFGILGQLSTLLNGSFMSQAHFLYFTNQSNLWIMAITCVLLVYDIVQLKKPVKMLMALQVIRFAFTVSISLTFIVFWALLTPPMLAQGDAAYLISVSNICVHTVVPLLAIADYFVDENGLPYKKSYCFIGIVMPLIYAAFALIGSACGLTFGSGKIVPYFFMDYQTLGWVSIGKQGIGVVWWIIILCAAVIGMSLLLLYLRKRCKVRLKK